jgi:hypothetical protein
MFPAGDPSQWCTGQKNFVWCCCDPY